MPRLLDAERDFAFVEEVGEHERPRARRQSRGCRFQLTHPIGRDPLRRNDKRPPGAAQCRTQSHRGGAAASLFRDGAGDARGATGTSNPRRCVMADPDDQQIVARLGAGNRSFKRHRTGDSGSTIVLAMACRHGAAPPATAGSPQPVAMGIRQRKRPRRPSLATHRTSYPWAAAEGPIPGGSGPSRSPPAPE